jgi:hypothetical protein
MAEYALIDSYLDVVSRRLEYRPDAVDLRDELADHLLESATRAIAAGLDRESAQRSTLDRFGDPNIVAGMLAAVPTKGIDMVHTLGRSAGTLALISAALWIVVIFAGPFGLVSYLDKSTTEGEVPWQSLVQALAVLVTGVALIALNLRSSKRMDALTGVVLVAAFMAFLVSFGVPWLFLAWGLYLAAALAVTIARLSGDPAAKGIVSALLLVIAPLLAVAGSIVGLQALAWDAAAGNPTSLDIQQSGLVTLLGAGVIALVLAVGLAVLGLRMRGATAVMSVQEPTAFA